MLQLPVSGWLRFPHSLEQNMLFSHKNKTGQAEVQATSMPQFLRPQPHSSATTFYFSLKEGLSRESLGTGGGGLLLFQHNYELKIVILDALLGPPGTNSSTESSGSAGSIKARPDTEVKEISSKPVNMSLLFLFYRCRGENICENTTGLVHLRYDPEHGSGLVSLSKQTLAKDNSSPSHTP